MHRWGKGTVLHLIPHRPPCFGHVQDGVGRDGRTGCQVPGIPAYFGQGQEVAIAGEPPAQQRGEAGQCAVHVPAPKEQLVAGHRTGGQHDPGSDPLPSRCGRRGRGGGDHRVPLAPRFDAFGFGIGDGAGTEVLRYREIGVVQRVLRSVVAADDAFTDEGTAPTWYAMRVRSPAVRIAEGHGQIGPHGGLAYPDFPGESLDQRGPRRGLAGARIITAGGDAHHVRGQVVVGIQLLPSQPRRPALVQRALEGAGEHVRVRE